MGNNIFLYIKNKNVKDHVTKLFVTQINNFELEIYTDKQDYIKKIWVSTSLITYFTLSPAVRNFLNIVVHFS